VNEVKTPLVIALQTQDRGAEIRCYMRDPDNYLIEVGQTTRLFA
jgi:hypothetical protein